MHALRFKARPILIGIFSSLAFVSAAGGIAYADELVGTAQIVGSGYSSKIILDSGLTKNPELCRGDVSKRVSRLSGMLIKAQGEWQLNKNGEKSCFAATEFAVTKTSNGRDAIVGVLTASEGRYQVSDAAGKVYKLGQLSSGLKKLEGKKVILDLNVINSPTAQDQSYKVVTYAEMP